jgi:hypothetical protein
MRVHGRSGFGNARALAHTSPQSSVIRTHGRSLLFRMPNFALFWRIGVKFPLPGPRVRQSAVGLSQIAGQLPLSLSSHLVLRTPQLFEVRQPERFALTLPSPPHSRTTGRSLVARVCLQASWRQQTAPIALARLLPPGVPASHGLTLGLRHTFVADGSQRKAGATPTAAGRQVASPAARAVQPAARTKTE